MVLVKRVSPLTGIENNMFIDITEEQIKEWNNPNRKKLIQDIFSNLSVDEREFIQTGYTPSDWKVMERMVKDG
tara:strand:+ start:426 stop:644 length:219 start_codon:yes stop_codon:yes gene_type:complete